MLLLPLAAPVPPPLMKFWFEMLWLITRVLPLFGLSTARWFVFTTAGNWPAFSTPRLTRLNFELLPFPAAEYGIPLADPEVIDQVLTAMLVDGPLRKKGLQVQPQSLRLPHGMR